MFTAFADRVSVPTAGNKVYKDECCYSSEDVYSDRGIFVNMRTWLSCGKHFLGIDSGRSDGNVVYFRIKHTKVPKDLEEKVEKMALGVEGGFNLTVQFSDSRVLLSRFINIVVKRRLDRFYWRMSMNQNAGLRHCQRIRVVSG